METLFSYSCAASIPLLLLWMAYRAALATGHRLTSRRITLLSIIVISLLLYPALCIIEPIFNNPGLTLSDSEPPYIFVFDNYSIDNISTFMHRMFAVWITGAATVLLLTAVELTRILIVINRSRTTKLCGRTVHITDNDRIAPFSFFGAIVISENDFNSHRQLIIAHETGHIHYRHSLDMLLVQATAILCWYNPAIWLIRRELKSVHEYQADNYTVAHGCDTRSYQMFLINRAIGSNFPTIANNLNLCRLKKRIAMMQDSRSTSRHQYLRFIPLAFSMALCVLTLGTPMVKAAINITRINTQQTDMDKIDMYIDGAQVTYDELSEIKPQEIKAITIDKTHNRIDMTSR